MTRLTINLLGGFQVQRTGSPVSGFSTDKTRALLAYLAVESTQSHRRQALAGLLWPDYPERSARTSLRTALANLRQVIGDHQAEPPFLLISRQSIAINLDSDVQVDVTSFTRLLEPGQGSQLSIRQFEEAIELYQGKLLEGFSLADSAPFDDWTLIKREQLNLQMLAALEQLAESYKQMGDRQKALQFVRRQVELEPWHEPAQRELIHLLAVSGHRAEALAHYEEFQELLSEELGVEPEFITRKLFQDIRNGKLHESISSPAYSVEITSALPSFLGEADEAEIDRPIFVGRAKQLNDLQSHLHEALDGHGRVVFVIGGAGRGKSVLMDEFVSQVQSKQPIPVAKGYCNAYSGGGDPYLPFRQVLDMLTGDVEDLWAAGQITKEQATLLWETLPDIASAVVETGPDLIETFLPGQPLLERTAAAVGTDTVWLRHLSRLVNARLTSQNPSDLDQHALIDQYAQVLKHTSQQVPLLIILEDLHWADQGSINLLLHLGRRLAGSRVLLLCAYRPDELALRGKRRPHPIVDLVNELRSQYGEIVIDLAVEDRSASQQFVDDLLDIEPNRLSESFRHALHNRTRGHPLFTVEMLRMLEEQGDLVKEADDRWIEGQDLAWDKVPARVEAVIQKRIDRLDTEAYELLTVASVEGEDFTAETVAQVLKKSERQVLHTLVQELGRKHRLLRERGETTTGRGYISRFRFSHHLIQRYVYNSLSPGERRLLHEAVATAMEDLYADDIESYIVQLAYHYSLAEVKDKALLYLTRAGHQAQKRYDGQQAVHYFSEALALETESTPDRFHLLAERAAVYNILAQREAQKADLDDMLALALSDFYLATEFFHAREPALKARALAEEIGDGVREAHALRRLSWEGRLGADFQTSRIYLEQAAARFKEAGQPGQAADCLFMLTRRLPASAKHVIDPAAAEQAMTLSHESGDYRLQAVARKNLAIAYTNQQRDAEALPLAEGALEMQRDLGDQREQSSTLDVIGVILARLGRREEAVSLFQNCLTLSEEIGSDWDILGAVFGFWNYWHVFNGEFEKFLIFIDERLDYASANDRDWLIGFLLWMKSYALTHLGQYQAALSLTKETAYQVTEVDLVAHAFMLQLSGWIKAQLDYYDEARDDLERALEIAEKTSDRYILSFPLSNLTDLALCVGEQETIRQGLEMMEVAVDAAAEENEERQWAEALDVRARLHLALNQPEQAFADSSQIMQLLESNPWLPRPQNHLHTHFLALNALGRKTEAEPYLQRAYERVMFVSEKFADDALRQSWLGNVQVNREIVRLWDKFQTA
jgi:DNA-binding SARP family transcriptional activator